MHSKNPNIGHVGFYCECPHHVGNKWIGDSLYCPYPAVNTMWDNWCYECFLNHQYESRTKKRILEVFTRKNTNRFHGRIIVMASQGYTHQEIANQIGKSRSFVSVHLHRLQKKTA